MSRTRTEEAPLCRAAFVRPSSAIRRAATSTAAGSGGSVGGIEGDAHRPPGRAPFVERGDVLAERADQADLVQGRRPQVIGDPPDLIDHPRESVASSSAARRLGQDRRQQAACRGDLHHRARKRRPELVVEVPAEPAAFLLASGHERLARAPQVGRQANRLDRRRRLPGQVGEQPLVGRAERLAVAARTQCQVTDGPAAIDDRQADEVAGTRRVDRALARRGLDLGPPGACPSRSTSMATYGERIASATASTRVGSTVCGSSEASSRTPSRRSARSGSSRSPNISRFTARWRRSWSGSATTATAPADRRATANGALPGMNCPSSDTARAYVTITPTVRPP